jgi:hypothetical protein
MRHFSQQTTRMPHLNSYAYNTVVSPGLANFRFNGPGHGIASIREAITRRHLPMVVVRDWKDHPNLESYS